MVLFADNVGPSNPIFANNVGRKRSCLRVLNLMFAGRNSYTLKPSIFRWLSTAERPETVRLVTGRATTQEMSGF